MLGRRICACLPLGVIRRQQVLTRMRLSLLEFSLPNGPLMRSKVHAVESHCVEKVQSLKSVDISSGDGKVATRKLLEPSITILVSSKAKAGAETWGIFLTCHLVRALEPTLGRLRKSFMTLSRHGWPTQVPHLAFPLPQLCKLAGTVGPARCSVIMDSSSLPAFSAQGSQGPPSGKSHN